MAHEGSLKTVLAALAANGGIAVSKFGAAFFTGSGTMLAEAIHSSADCLNQIMLLWGMKEAQAPESDEHPLGHYRVVYFWAMMVGLMLFGLGSVFSIYEGIEHLRHPSPLHEPIAALAVLLISVVLEGWSLITAMKEVKAQLKGKTFRRWFKESRHPETLVVVSEDIGALLGLVIALIALVLTIVTGNPVFDALGSLAVGLVLGVISWQVMTEMKSLVVGESVSPEVRLELEAFIAAQPEVEKVFRVITLAWGERMVVAVKAKMAYTDTADAMVDAINVVEDRIQQKWPAAKWVFFEPDVR